MEKKAVTYRLDDDVIKEINSFAESRGVSKSDAVRLLIVSGLASEKSGLYGQPVAGIVRDLMRGELGLFRQYQELLVERDSELIVDTFKDILSTNTGALMLLLTMFCRESEADALDDMFEIYRSAGRLALSGYSYTDALRKAEALVIDSRLASGLKQEEGFL